jgi:molybdenum cofactor cytidylyltransferase
MRSAAIILAAGASTRLGSPKQLVQFRGKTLLEHAIDAGRACDRVIIVLGAHADTVHTVVPSDVEAVMNPSWSDGLSGSIRAGVGVLLDEKVCAVLLCDQPHVTREHVSRLLDEQRETNAPIVATEYGEVLGVPAVFERCRFATLAALRGDEGARKVISQEAVVGRVRFDGAMIDVDGPDDVRRLGL